jgi:diacylglycerol kinase family enzyme
MARRASRRATSNRRSASATGTAGTPRGLGTAATSAAFPSSTTARARSNSGRRAAPARRRRATGEMLPGRWYHAPVRLLLIANINAQTVTPRMADVIHHALASEFEVELVRTKRAEHAMHLAKGAVHEEVDVVVSFGGDGTVNETVNGLAGSQTPMGIIPGGGTNVLARSLGIPKDPIEATAHFLSAHRGKPRRITLGRADGRYFTFACGMGFDGAIVREVERRQTLKKTVGQGYYLWSGVRIFFAGVDRRDPPISLRWGPDLEHGRDGLFVAICQKTRPFTYLGNREMNICPQADLDLGVDCFAMDRFTVPFVLRMVGHMFGSARHVRNRHTLYLHDQQRIEISSATPLPMQMDGEYLGDRTRILVESVPDALSIVC